MTHIGGEKRTPMAWQHRDMNYHQAGYQDRYGAALDMGVPMRPGPSSTSDRLSHRTDKSWRTQKDSHVAYPPARPYSSGRPSSRTHSGSSSETSSSSTESETEQEDIHHRSVYGPPHLPPSAYGYYPGYAPSTTMGYPPSISQYPGTVKSAKSVPTVGTWDGEPCPVHGMGPMTLPGMPHPPMMMPGPTAMTLPPKRASSIYDIRLMGHPPPPPMPMFHTLPPKPMPGDRRSLAFPPSNIPSQFLPPMARPRPLVVSEDGTAEPLPVRSPQEKVTKNGLPINSKGSDTVDKGVWQKVSCPGGVCVGLIVISVISAGLLLGVLLVFIL